METLTQPESMDEFSLRALGNKLVNFGIIKNVSVIEKHGLCQTSVNEFPKAIFQNTICPHESPGVVGHWVCLFLKLKPNRNYSSHFYDSLGNNHIWYDICVPANCVSVNSFQHQPNDSKLCSLYCLFFITNWAIDKASTQTLNNLFHPNLLKNNDKLVLEFYHILLKSSDRKEFLHCLFLLKKFWCKDCALLFCACKYK